MARVPEGADLIENRLSGAPGIRAGNVFLMAGVPSITAQMLDGLTGKLEGGLPLLSHTVGCWVAESEIADLLRETEASFAGVQIGSYPFFREGRTGANFVIRSTDATMLAACARSLGEALATLGREPFDGGI
jgi:molybdopterin-biosynthesis enzyme MoeA-like protein